MNALIWMLLAAVVIAVPGFIVAEYYSRRYSLGAKPYWVFFSIVAVVWVIVSWATADTRGKRRSR